MKKEELNEILSGLESLRKKHFDLEQHQTDSNLASETLLIVNKEANLKNKVIADLGCGSGIFGLGCLALGAKQVFFVDIDKDALKVAEENKKILEKKLKKKLNAVFLNEEVNDFNSRVNIVVQNPPLLFEKTHLDKIFLLRAMELSNKVYSFHKVDSSNFIKDFCNENKFDARMIKTFNVPLLKRGIFGIKSAKNTNIGFWKIEKFKK